VQTLLIVVVNFALKSMGTAAVAHRRSGLANLPSVGGVP